MTSDSECKGQGMYIHSLNGAKNFCITMLIPVGSKSDNKRKGIAHYVEHMLIESLKNDNVFLRTYKLRATTSCNYTAYMIEGECSQCNIVNAYVYLWRIVRADFLSKSNMMKVRCDIIREYLQKRVTYNMKIVSKLCRALGINSNFPIGNLINICTISYKDICKFVNNAYAGAEPEFFFVGDYSEVNIGDIYCKLDYSTSIARFIRQRKVRETGRECIAMICSKWPQKSIHVLMPDLFVEDTMRSRVAIDYLISILDDYIVEYFAVKIGERVRCQVAIERIEDMPYVHIIVYGCRVSCLHTKELYEYVKKRIIGEFELNRLKMYDQITENNYINLFDWSNEMISKYMYNTPLFDIESYCKCVQTLQLKDIIYALSVWFSSIYDN